MKIIKYLILLLTLTYHTTHAAGHDKEEGAQPFNRPVHYIRELRHRHPNMTNAEMYARFCKEQEEELTALQIEHTPLQEELTWEEYHAREGLIETRNTEIMKGIVLKWRDYGGYLSLITSFNGTRIPINLWQRLREDPEITEQDLDKTVLVNLESTQYPLRFIPPCFFEGMRFKKISLPNQNLIALPDTLENTIGDLIEFDISSDNYSNSPNTLHTFPDVLFSCEKLMRIFINNTCITQSAKMLDEAFLRATIFFSEGEKSVISEEGYARKKHLDRSGNHYILHPKPEEKKEESDYSHHSLSVGGVGWELEKQFKLLEALIKEDLMKRGQ